MLFSATLASYLLLRLNTEPIHPAAVIPRIAVIATKWSVSCEPAEITLMRNV